MRYLCIIFLCVISLAGRSQGFPTTDSLRGYNTKYTTNSALLWFSNLRGQTLLRGIIDFLDTVKTGALTQPVVDTLYSVDDSTLRYRSKGTFITFYNKGVYDYRRKVDTVYGLTDTSFAANINGQQRIIIIRGKGISAADTTNKWINNVYRKTGTDSVFFVKGSTATFAFKDSTGGGSGTPAGSNTQIQYNNSGAFGASANLTWDNTARRLFIDKGSSDSAAITIDQAYTGQKRWLTIRPPVKTDSTVNFDFWSELNPNDNGTRSNHILKIGSNQTLIKSTIPAIWDAWESNWYSSGSRYLERHYEVKLANNESVRLFSNTLIAGTTLAGSTSTWDFRSGTITFTPLRYNSQAGIFMNTGTSGGTATLRVEGATPYFWTKDTISNGQTTFQQQDAKTMLINGSGVQINSKGNDNLNLKLDNSSSTGSSGLLMSKVDGTYYYMRVTGSASGTFGTLTNELQIRNSSSDQYVMRFLNNGSLILGRGHNQTDNSYAVQIYGASGLGLWVKSKSLFDGSVFATKDSVPTVTTLGSNMVLAIDTATGKFNRMTKAPIEESLFQSGTYTPTVTNITNIAAASASTGHYQRIGNVITVHGSVTIQPTASATDTEITLSLPIASALVNEHELAGVGATQTDNQSLRIYPDVTNDRARFRMKAGTTNSVTYSYNYRYIYIAP